MELIISARYSAYTDHWTGLCILKGMPGTHEHYNVIYNGDCQNEYFYTEENARLAAYLAFVGFMITRPVEMQQEILIAVTPGIHTRVNYPNEE